MHDAYVEDEKIFEGLYESFIVLLKAMLTGDYQIDGNLSIYNIVKSDLQLGNSGTALPV